MGVDDHTVPKLGRMRNTRSHAEETKFVATERCKAVDVGLAGRRCDRSSISLRKVLDVVLFTVEGLLIHATIDTTNSPSPWIRGKTGKRRN